MQGARKKRSRTDAPKRNVTQKAESKLSLPDLPEDVLAHLLPYLQQPDQQRLRVVNKRLHDVIDVCITQLVLDCSTSALKDVRCFHPERLPLIIRKCRNLTRLRVLEPPVIDDALLGAIANCHRLLFLEIGKPFQGASCSPRGVAVLATGCPHLIEILCEWMSDQLFEPLATHCTELRRVKLKGDITDVGLQLMSYKLPKLQNICLLDVNNVTNTGLGYLSRGCTELRELILGNDTYASGITHEGMISLVRQCHILVHISLAYLPSAVNNDVIRTIGERCPNLRYLSIKRCTNGPQRQDVTDDGMFSIASHCHNLRVLLLPEAKITDSSVDLLALNCTALQELDVRGSVFVSQKAILSLCKACPHLQMLSMFAMDLTPEGADAICQSSASLQDLRLPGLRLDIDVMRSIAGGVPSLRYLDFNRFDRTAEELFRRLRPEVAVNTRFLAPGGV